MDRTAIAQLCERDVLEIAARRFGTSQDRLAKFDDYEGCANLVYHYERDSQPRVLRISYRPDRPVEVIQAELHFVEYLAEGGVRVSRPVPSVNGNLLEVIPAGGISFIAVSFRKGRGMRVPDNDYRYRPGVPIQEYFQNWGQVLGQLHRLAKTYQPLSDSVKRPEWFTWEYDRGFPYGERLPVIHQKYDQLIAELRALPQGVDSYGLIHNDFNDGNFTVDYDNGDITVFDFDDSCYFWFMYDIACAWEGGIGRAMFRPLEERKDFMARYLEHVLAGYTRENSLSDEWLVRLPLFLRLIQMQELMHFAQYLDEPDEELQAGLRYKIRCIENDIPYLGFFDDSVFSPERPFELSSMPTGAAMDAPPSETIPDIHFLRITATTMNQICALSETLPPAQRHMVADNVRSIAEAHFSESAWMRAIYADETPIGFIMTHTGSDYEDGIDCPGVFLWRFMIAAPYQGKGYGKRALEKLIQHLKAMGVPVLYTSCGQGEGSPEGFYRQLGFTPTGDYYGEEGEEIELVLNLDTYAVR